jgi:hypothetical protein
MKEQSNQMRPNNPQSAIRNPQSVELHIEELVLDGFAPGDRYLIAESIEREVALLLAELGVPSSLARGGEIACLNAGALEIAEDSRAGAIGARVARALYEGLDYTKTTEPLLIGEHK